MDVFNQVWSAFNTDGLTEDGSGVVCRGGVFGYSIVAAATGTTAVEE